MVLQAKEDATKPKEEQWLFSSEREVEDEELLSEGQGGLEGMEEEQKEVDEEVED